MLNQHLQRSCGRVRAQACVPASAFVVAMLVAATARADVPPPGGGGMPREQVVCNDDCSAEGGDCVSVDLATGLERLAPKPEVSLQEMQRRKREHMPESPRALARNRARLASDNFTLKCRGFSVTPLGGRFCTRQGDEHEVWCRKSIASPATTATTQSVATAVTAASTAAASAAPTTSSLREPHAVRETAPRAGCAATPAQPAHTRFIALATVLAILAYAKRRQIEQLRTQ